MSSNKTQEKWSSSLGFIIAATGSAIGLSNIWKFPYTMGQNGGSAFLIVYLISSAFLALPALIIDTLLGRRGRGLSPIESTRNVLKESGHKMGVFGIYGIIGGVVSVFLLAYYSVIGSWATGYIYNAIIGNISKLQTPEESYGIFNDMTSNPLMMFIQVLLTMIPTILVVTLGIERGIEKFSTIFVSFMGIYVVGLFFFSMSQPGFKQAMIFMFKPDFSKITPATVVEAVGQSFFTVSVGLCHVAIYGAMLDKEQNIIKTSIIVTVLNTLFSLFVGVAIFSLVFSKGMDPAGGTPLVFGVLPLIFKQTFAPGFMTILFFLMFYFAGLTSAFPYLEATVQTLMGIGVKRKVASVSTGIVVIILSLIPIFGYNIWKDFRLLPFGDLKSLNLLDSMDFIVSSFFYPLNSIFLFLIVGFMTSKAIKTDELELDGDSILYKCFDFLLKFIAPISLFCVLLSMMGIIKF